MPASFPSKLTLPAALLLGAALGVVAMWGEPAPSSRISLAKETSSAAADREPPSASRASGKSAPSRSDASSTSAAYAAAWEALYDGKLPAGERTQIQQALLAEWCLVDLEAALRAALGENLMSLGDPFSGGLLDSCHPGIMTDPEFVWRLIEEGRFGIKTTALRDEWIEAMGEKAPLRLLDRLHELPDWKAEEGTAPRQTAILAVVEPALFGRVDPALGAAVFEKLAHLPEGEDGEELFDIATSMIYMFEGQGALFERLQSATDPAVRHLLLVAYAKRVRSFPLEYRGSLLEALPSGQRADLERALEQLPGE